MTRICPCNQMVSLQTRIILENKMLLNIDIQDNDSIQTKNFKKYRDPIRVIWKVLKYKDYENVHNRTRNHDKKKKERKNRWMRKSRKSRNSTDHIDAEVCNDTEDGRRNLRRLDNTQSLENTVKIGCEQKCIEMIIMIIKWYEHLPQAAGQGCASKARVWHDLFDWRVLGEQSPWNPIWAQ